MKLVTASIVSYKSDYEMLKRAINSFLRSDSNRRVFLIDNSPFADLKPHVDFEKLQYIHNPSNPGFGASHNIGIDLAKRAGSQYHFIINPDTYFETDVISPMVTYMEENLKVGMMMPEILNVDGTVQYLPKLLPHPFWIVWRKLKRPAGSFKRFIDKYELRAMPPQRIYNTPILSGCFTLLNINAIAEIGGYDGRFFMYFEDFDLSRRMHMKYETIYFPQVSVYHNYEGGANKSFKLFMIFLSSAIYYFNKWGWFFDTERKYINKKVLQQV